MSSEALLRKTPSLFILFLLAPFASVFAVLYTPALPDLAQALNITDSQAQLSMTVFLIGYALGNLPYGPLSNRYGRKPTIYIGIFVALIGTLIIILAGATSSFSLLIIGRLIAALGSSVGLKISFTIVGDVYAHTEAVKKISHILLAFSIAPGLSIALGGLLAHYFGWESCFYALALYGALLFFLSSRLPETAPQLEKNALNIPHIIKGLANAFKSKQLVTCAIIMGCVTSFVYLFAAEAPFIGINHIGLKADTYGFLNCIPSLGMIAGLLASHSLAGKYNTVSIITLGAAGALLFSSLMLLLFLGNIVNTWTLFIPMPFIYVGLSLVLSNASALAVSGSKNKSNASAVMNFINMGISVIALMTAETLPHAIYSLPLFCVFLALTILGIRFFSTLQKK